MSPRPLRHPMPSGFVLSCSVHEGREDRAGPVITGGRIGHRTKNKFLSSLAMLSRATIMSSSPLAPGPPSPYLSPHAFLGPESWGWELMRLIQHHGLILHTYAHTYPGAPGNPPHLPFPPTPSDWACVMRGWWAGQDVPSLWVSRPMGIKGCSTVSLHSSPTRL